MRSASKGGSPLLLIVLLIAGVAVGAAVALPRQRYGWASFLTRTATFGIGDAKPLSLDLSVLHVYFGVGLHINLAEALCLLAAVLLYRRLR